MCLAIPGKLTEISTDATGVRLGTGDFGEMLASPSANGNYRPDVTDLSKNQPASRVA